jgi:type I restriction enzyme, R subunit
MASTPDLVERTVVEEPLIAQLRALGWSHVEGDRYLPASTERDDFRELVLRGRLSVAVRYLNPTLTDAEVSRTIAELERLTGLPGGPVAVNRAVLDAITVGVKIAPDDPSANRDITVALVDFENRGTNDFLAINQFRLDPPGMGEPIIPDVVLFVNGLPLVVIECKSPAISEPMDEAIGQLLRYSNQRNASQTEGVPRLFAYNALMIGTSFDEARVASVGTPMSEYRTWVDTYPMSPAEVQAAVGGTTLSAQHRLVAGMLLPDTLLDMVQVFMVFEDRGVLKKKVARYQQFRAVRKLVEQMQSMPAHEPGTLDDGRGGIVFHYQGSGKTLTMVFLVRKMRLVPSLRRFKVVLLVDRTNLQEQLEADAVKIGDPLVQPGNSAALVRELRRGGRALVLATIQKWRDRDDAPLLAEHDDTTADDVPRDVNTSSEILVLADEGHRTHAGVLHANVIRALPNAAKIAFTGTPILDADRRTTAQIFGPIRDSYTITDSQRDGVTVPIKYEGKESRDQITDPAELDRRLVEQFPEATDEELRAVRARYVRRTGLLEAPKPIAVKARDIFRHYVDSALPNRFKALVAAGSRAAAVNYRDALLRARDELVTELEARDAEIAAVPLDEIDARDDELGFLARAGRDLEMIRLLDVATVVTGTSNQPAAWNAWTDPDQNKQRTEEFRRKPLGLDATTESRLAIICVKNMLLTGFDVLPLQVLYIDRPIHGVDLFQAIGRVNRSAPGKSHGLVVDYHGLAEEIADLIRRYSTDQPADLIVNVNDELPRLEEKRNRAFEMFASRGIDAHTVAGYNAAVDLLADATLRGEFFGNVDGVARALDITLPRPAALRFVADMKLLGKIRRRAITRYRDGVSLPPGASAKVQRLIDAHLESEGIDVRVTPIEITDVRFPEHVRREPSARAKALEMEHALRHHIRVHFDDDPVAYATLHEQLEALLASNAQRWEQLVFELTALVDVVRGNRPTGTPAGVDAAVEGPFWRILANARAEGTGVAAAEPRLIALTHEVVDDVRGAVRAVDFWRNSLAQERLRAGLVRRLDGSDLFPFERLESLAGEVISIARRQHARLLA